MAYDRYENRGGWRDDDRRERGQSGGGRDERGFFERARDEVSSWFGEDDGYRQEYDDRGSGQHRERSGGGAMFGGGRDRDDHRERSGSTFGGGQSSSYGRGREGGDYRNQYGRGGGESGGFGGGDYTQQNRSPWRSHQDDDRSRGYPGTMGQSGGGSYSPRGGGRDYGRQDHGRHEQGRSFGGGYGRNDDDYRPMAGDYGRSGQESRHSGMGSQDFGRPQYGRQEFSQDQDRDRGFGDRSYNYGGWGDDDSRRQSGGSRMGSAMMGGGAMLGGGRHDEHYSQWRQRQIEELDRDYDEYRREHQSKFENEFGGWRQQRQTKRQMLQSIREHSEVVDQNGEHVGTVDKVRGDTVILTKNDPEAGGVHRSFTCSLLERVEGGKVYLSGTKESLRSQLHEERDEGRERSGGGGFVGALFGRGRDDDDRREERSESSEHPQSGEGPHILDRSFSGTYDDDDRNK